MAVRESIAEAESSGLLDTGDGHRIYYELHGRLDAMPAVFLHGGPGGRYLPMHRRLFDPALFRTVFFDQRGCGRSLPRGELQQNTSEHLVADIERLREHLGIERWLVVGGSWGAGLAIAYAAAHPASCLGLVLRGVFLGRACDLDWFFLQARQLLPDAWDAMARAAPPLVHERLLAWLHDGLHGDQAQRSLERALLWVAWETALTNRRASAPESPPQGDDAVAALVDKYRIQSHYLVNGCFWGEHALLQRARSLGDIPTSIVHGRLDWICRPQAAWDLHQSLPGSRLIWVDEGGHSPFEPAMARALSDAMAQACARP